jgi:hypothetical protein
VLAARCCEHAGLASEREPGAEVELFSRAEVLSSPSCPAQLESTVAATICIDAIQDMSPERLASSARPAW